MNPATNHHLLRTWLGLPAGAWPPDHYALLGLTPGPCDPAALEARVLDRMDRLRGHQLLHPELVTEGMNRLAQALICLSDPAAKTAYDAELGVAAEPLPTDDVPAVTEVAFEPGLLPPGAAPPSPGLPPAPPGALVVVLPYEVVPPEELPPEEPPPAADPLPPVGAELPVASAPAKGDRAARRWIYARLALVRKSLRAWDQLRPVLADPRDSLDRPARVLLLLEAVRDVRPLLPRLRELIRGGRLVAAVVSQPSLCDTIRSLLPDQRQALAIDWRRGQVELQREHRRLRDLSRAGREPRTGPNNWRVLAQWLMRTPEAVLVLLAAAAVLVALVRGSGR